MSDIMINIAYGVLFGMSIGLPMALWLWFLAGNRRP